MSLSTKATHAQLDIKTHQVVIQCACIHNNQNKPMSLMEIKQELYECNRIEKSTLALRPYILVAQNTLDNVVHGPIMITFHNKTDVAHIKTYRLFFRGDHCYIRDYIKMKRMNRCLNCHELMHPTHSCSCKPRCIHCTSTEHMSAEHPKHKCKECEKDMECPHNNLKCANCKGNHAANNPGCLVLIEQRGLQHGEAGSASPESAQKEWPCI